MALQQPIWVSFFHELKGAVEVDVLCWFWVFQDYAM